MSGWQIKFSNSRQQPYFFNSETRESVWEAPSSLSENDIKSLPGYDILRRGGPEKVRACHLLVKHNQSRRPASWKDPQITRSKDEAVQILKGFESQLRPLQGNDLIQTFNKLAQEHSDCSSHSKGGDLGRFTRGQMQKPFEDATFSLQPGQMSPIIDTDSGVHLIIRVE